jgi:transposase
VSEPTGQHPNRATKPAFDEHLYRERHRIENTFARLKFLRRIATRYEKLHDSFASMRSARREFEIQCSCTRQRGDPTGLGHAAR